MFNAIEAVKRYNVGLITLQELHNVLDWINMGSDYTYFEIALNGLRATLVANGMTIRD